MATQTTTTYLQLVNNAIDEAGEDLASFAVDGSDFTTATDPMMNRFKKWVARAWRTIQQECYDWEWMQSQAVVTINPGIMFYTHQPISSGTAAINPAEIIDVNGDTVITGLTVDGVQSLPALSTQGITTGQLPSYLGYMDVRYSDYDVGSTHVLDFGLKAGGERLTRQNDGRVRLMAVFNSANAYTAASFMEVGDGVDSVTVEDVAHSVTNTYTFTSGRIDSKVVDGTFVTLQLSYKQASGDMFDTLMAYAAASGAAFNVAVSFDVATSAGTKTIDGALRFDDIGNQFILTAAVSPINYKVNFTSTIGIADNVHLGDSLDWAYYSTTKAGNVKNIISPISATVDEMFPDLTGTSGILNISLNAETGVSYKVLVNGVEQTSQMCFTLWSSLLFATAPVCQANYPGAIFYTTSGYDGTSFDTNYAISLGLYNTFTDTVLATFSFEYEQPYPYQNYVHSWKSFNWDEEMDDGGDFIPGSIREVNNTTFKITRHEDPAPVSDLPVQYIAWSSFQNVYDFPSLQPGLPRLITEDNVGRWRLFPPPDRPYTLQFQYSREAQELVNATDVPKGMTSEFVDMVMWRALQYYGEYDEQPSVANRAKGNYKNMLMEFEIQQRPKPYFKPRQLW